MYISAKEFESDIDEVISLLKKSNLDQVKEFQDDLDESVNEESK